MSKDFDYHPHIQQYLDRLKGLPNKSENTYQVRRSDLKKFNRWARRKDLDITEIEPLKLERFFIWLNEEEYAPNTIGCHFDSVHAFYSELVDKFEVIEESPAKKLDRADYVKGKTRKHDEEDIVYVTEEEKEQLAENVPAPKLRNELLVRLLWQTGLRESEVAGLKIDNIDREEREIEVWSPKVDDWRTVFYRPNLDFFLDQWLDGGYRARFTSADDSDYLLVTRKSPRFRNERPNKVVKKAAENAGIQDVMYRDQAGNRRYRITAHALRHGHAVFALKCGIDVRTVQKHMGHASVDLTMNYLQLIDEDLKESYKRFGNKKRG